MAACELMDLDDDEFFRITQSHDNETSVKTINNGPPIPEGMKYHLFISHSNDSDDEVEWARGVVKTLEEDFGLKCVFPSRDLLAGCDVLSQITDGIVKSAKIVCVFTPDSLESIWCKYERNLALNLSMSMERGKLIPVLLKECEIPDMFRFMNYIDVVKGEDYIQRILGSFNDSDVPNMERVVQEIVATSRRRFNEAKPDRLPGIRCSMYGHRTRLRGAAWSFKKVTAHERDTLGILKNQFSKKLYNKARDIANQSLHLRYYSLSCDVCRTPFLFVLLTLAFALPVILIILLVERTKQAFIISGTLDFYKIIVLGFVFFPCGAGIIFFMFFFYWKAFRNLKAEIRSLCLQQVLESNLLVNYGAWNRCGPPCVYMTEFRVFHSNMEATEDLKIRCRKQAQEQILRYLRENIDALFEWSGLPTSTVHRHPTCQSKACLCEILLAT